MELTSRTREIAGLAATSLLLFLITDKICHIFCELSSRILLINKDLSTLHHFVAFAIIIGISFWLFVRLYHRLVESKAINFTLVLSLTLIYLGLVMWMIVWSVIRAKILPFGEMPAPEEAMNIYGYSRSMPKLLFVLQIVFLLFKIKKE